MQFINKSHLIPPDWDAWFTTANNSRSYDYVTDYSQLHNLRMAKEHLLNEQSGLCAYCQKQLSIDNASIEHIIPKSHNTALSTNYYNLVAVCKNPPIDPSNNKTHCDRERGNKLLVNIVLHQNAQVTHEQNHFYFSAYTDGTIIPKNTLPDEISDQVKAFLNILNLNNHAILKANRRELLNKILQPWQNMSGQDKRRYLSFQFNRIYNSPTLEYRQYLLICIANKLGIN